MGAACEAGASPMSGAGVARSAEVAVSVAGISRTLNLGGFAIAEFPDKTQEELSQVRNGEALGLIWRDAHFLGADAILGPVEVVLRKDRRSEGAVFSLDAQPTALAIDDTQFGFFPARNRNSFHFDLHLPRLGLTMNSASPIVNSAIITQIPPVGSVYELETVVRFARVAAQSSLLSTPVQGVDIKSCNVKLHVSGGIELTILSVRDDGNEISCEAQATNVTGTETIGVTWMIWPRPPSDMNHPKGTLILQGNKPTRFDFKADRNMFFQARFIAISASWPFSASASGAIVMPSLI